MNPLQEFDNPPYKIVISSATGIANDSIKLEFTIDIMKLGEDDFYYLVNKEDRRLSFDLFQEPEVIKHKVDKFINKLFKVYRINSEFRYNRPNKIGINQIEYSFY